MAELGQATFFDYVRGSRTKEGLELIDDGSPRLKATIDLNIVGSRPSGATPAAVSTNIHLLGPADIIGIAPAEILRVFPASGEPAAEPNYLAAIEFDSTEVPWLASLAVQEAKPMPWITLVVVADDGTRISHRSGSPVPWLDTRAGERPPCDEAWAWAHAQVVGKAADAHSDLGDGRRTLSRLLCPTKLSPNTRYLAAVVPTYQAGIHAARGESAKGAGDTLAWATTDGEVELPVYYWWRFSTGPAGDFEQLARQLRPMDASQLTDIGKFPLHLPKGGIGELGPETPLQAVRTLLTTEQEIAAMAGETTEAPVSHALASAVDPAAGEDEARIVRPPRYGQFPAGNIPVETGPPWYGPLNLTPSTRVIARVGADVVRAQQEELVADAQRQLGAYERARRARDHLRLGELSTVRLYRRTLDVIVAPDERVLALSRPAFPELAASMDAPVAAALERQGLGAALLAPALARVAQRASRRTLFAAAALRTQLVAGMLDRTLIALAPPPEREGIEFDRLRRVYTRADLLQRPIGELTVDKMLTLAKPAASLQTELASQFAGKQLAVHKIANEERVVAIPEGEAIGQIEEGAHHVALHLDDAAVVIHEQPHEQLLGEGLGHGALHIHPIEALAVQPLVGNVPVAAFAPVLLQHVDTPVGVAFDAFRRVPEVVAVARVPVAELTLDASVIASADEAVGVLTQFGVAPPPATPLSDLVVDAKTVTLAKQLVVGVAAAQPELVAFDVQTAVRRQLGLSFTQPVLRDQLPAVDQKRFDQVVDLIGKRLLTDDVRFPAAPAPVTVAAAAAPCRLGLVASTTYIAAAAGRLVFAGGLVPTAIQMGFVPTFTAPLVARLQQALNRWILAGAANIPPNAVTMLVTNPAFVEALVAGANHEMARELLWRDVPSDPRGTVFQRFWDSAPMPPLHTWTEALGRNLDGTGEPYIAVVLRSPLLRRYPNAIVYASKGSVTAENFEPDPAAPAPRLPLYTGFVEPDITFSVIDLNPSEVRDDDGNWYLLLAEPVGEPRFGLDAEAGPAVGPDADADDPAVRPLKSWQDLAWTDTDDAILSPVRPPGGSATLEGITWGASSADLARILHQDPFRVVLRAKSFLKKQAPP